MIYVAKVGLKMFCFSIEKKQNKQKFPYKNREAKRVKNTQTNSCLSKKSLANRLFKQP
jgi:hypothetical protein